jgi:hypothetical protein
MSESPYQSPTDDNGESPGNGWYKPDHRALTYAELWRICSKPGPFVVAALKKAMGVAISGPATFKSLEPIIVLREDQIGADALKRLQPLVAECLAHDFELAFYGTGEHRGAQGFAAHLWKRDETTWALVISSIVRVKTITRESLFCQLMSYLEDETILTTANRRRQLNAPPNYSGCYLHGASIGDVVRRHSDRLAAQSHRATRIQRAKFYAWLTKTSDVLPNS